MFDLEVETPRKSIPTGTRHLTQKRWRYSQKCALQSCARNHKKIKKHLNMICHPIAGGPPLGRLLHLFAWWVAPTT